MKKNIWIINHYATSMYKNKGGRHFWFAKIMKEKGYNPVIICANTYHNSNNLIDTKDNLYSIKVIEDIPFIFIKTVPSTKNNYQRILNMWLFYKNLLKSYKSILKEFETPKLIYASSVHPLTLVAGIKIARKLNIPCLSEIRDLWPEAIFKFTRLKEDSLLGKILIRGEHWIYKNSDALVFTKEGDIDYLKEKNWLDTCGGDIAKENCYYINNGVNISLFNEQAKMNIVEDADLNSKCLKIIYTGAIRPVNKLDKIIKVADYLKEYDDMKFLIYGDGNEKKQLETYVKNHELKNIIFKGNIDKKNIPYILNQADIALLNYSQESYEWSRGNSSNKLFEYFAAGKPVLSTVKLGYSPIKKYDCGMEVEGDNSTEEIAEKILKFRHIYFHENTEYKKYCKNSRLASKEFDMIFLTDKLINITDKLIN